MDRTAHANCRRCGRPLRSVTSVAAGYGPVCQRRLRKAAQDGALTGFSPAQRDKAIELVESGGIAPIRGRRIFQVVASSGAATYKTAITGQCNCPAGLRGRTVCYHVGAARVVAAA